MHYFKSKKKLHGAQLAQTQKKVRPPPLPNPAYAHGNVNPRLYVDNIPNSIVIPDISQEAVISVIKSLKNSAPGYDDFSNEEMHKLINISRH